MAKQISSQFLRTYATEFNGRRVYFAMLSQTGKSDGTTPITYNATYATITGNGTLLTLRTTSAVPNTNGGWSIHENYFKTMQLSTCPWLPPIAADVIQVNLAGQWVFAKTTNSGQLSAGWCYQETPPNMPPYAFTIFNPNQTWNVTSPALATGVYAYIPSQPVNNTTVIGAATDRIPASGGEVEASQLSGNIPGSATGGVVALTTGTLHSVGVRLDQTDAIATQANVTLTVSGNTITSDFLMGSSTASCGLDQKPAVVGRATLENIKINGKAVSLTGTTNQVVKLPNGTAIINEQQSFIKSFFMDPNGRVHYPSELIVIALHVMTMDKAGSMLADVRLGIGDAQIDCPWSPPVGDATSGGGWISLAPGGRGTFGVVGGHQPDSTTMGHLVYIDHNINFSVQSTSITSFTPGCTSQINGDGTSSGASVHFSVTVSDNGEPGSSDTFTINVTDLSNVPIYSESGTLGGGVADEGGNIRSHRPPCS